MLITYAVGSATVFLIASYLFVFKVVGFIIDDLKKKKKRTYSTRLVYHALNIYLFPTVMIFPALPLIFILEQ